MDGAILFSIQSTHHKGNWNIHKIQTIIPFN